MPPLPHSHVAFLLLADTQLLAPLSAADQRTVRSLIIEGILHTDMATHKALVDQLTRQAAYDVVELNRDSLDDRQFLISVPHTPACCPSSRLAAANGCAAARRAACELGLGTPGRRCWCTQRTCTRHCWTRRWTRGWRTGSRRNSMRRQAHSPTHDI